MNATLPSRAALKGFTIAVGVLLLALTSGQTASAQTNTKTGTNAGISMTTGVNNTADGFSALQFDTSGSENVAVGSISLKSNLVGSYNTALGFGALTINTASYNTAVGSNTLYTNTSGTNNVAVGYTALFANGTGNYNTAVGSQALRYDTGASNTAVGFGALFKNTTGEFNVALGDGALLNNTTGSRNIALGEDAGYNLTVGSDNISIGNKAVVGESATIRIGTTAHKHTYLAGVIHGNGSALTGVIVPAARVTGTFSTTQIANGAVTSTKLGSSLTLGGTTTGTFTGNLTGNASTATTSGYSAVAGVALSGGSIPSGQKEFATPGGPFPFTIPAGVSRIMVEAWSAGGGGGGTCFDTINGFTIYGGNGGTGAYSRVILGVNAGQAYDVTIGHGGSRGTDGTNTAGTDGTDGGVTKMAIHDDTVHTVVVSSGGGKRGTGGALSGGGRDGVAGTPDPAAAIGRAYPFTQVPVGPPADTGVGGGGNGYLLITW